MVRSPRPNSLHTALLEMKKRLRFRIVRIPWFDGRFPCPSPMLPMRVISAIPMMLAVSYRGVTVVRRWRRPRKLANQAQEDPDGSWFHLRMLCVRKGLRRHRARRRRSCRMVGTYFALFPRLNLFRREPNSLRGVSNTNASGFACPAKKTGFD